MTRHPSFLDQLEQVEAQRDELLAALKGIEADATEMLLDICADIQEGNADAIKHAAKWDAVIAAIAKAEGRS